MTISFDEDKQNRKVDELREKEEEEVAKILSEKYNIHYVDLSGISISSDALKLIPEETARTANVAAFKIVGKKLSIAVYAPEHQEVIQIIDKLKEKDYIIELYMASRRSLAKAWERYKDLSFAMETKAGTLDISNEEVENFLKQVKTLKDIIALVDESIKIKKVYRISKLIGIVVAGALSTKASDVHIEPEESVARLRYRLDGVLVDVLNFDKETYELLLSRIKLLSGLKINIKDNAQDGRFSVKIYNDDIEIRTSTLPGTYGESIVMRILNPKSIMVPLEEMGIPKKLLDIFAREINKPNGMILTTGPTGSGKTTTLYAFLRKVHTPEIKIVTIEDPVEYHLPGIVQTQTNPEKDYTFATGLKSTLRQDPDVIMVGEIRDSETASIAVQAALTGHLVFSTLHTNNAAGAFPRLIDLGVNPKILTSAINVAIAQRLLRRVCKACGKKVPIPENKKEIVKVIVEKIKKKGETVTQEEFVWEPVGCLECHNTGYNGRIGIYEAITIDKQIEQAVNENPSERDIMRAAESQHILTLGEDSIQKALAGITTLPEIERVVDLTLEVDRAEKLETPLE
jgi:type IV pilus assembly protein PilB